MPPASNASLSTVSIPDGFIYLKSIYIGLKGVPILYKYFTARVYNTGARRSFDLLQYPTES